MSSPSRASRDRRLIWILAGALAVAVILLIASFSRPGDDRPGDSAGKPGPSASASAKSDQDEKKDDTDQDAEEAQQRLPDLARRIDGDPAAIGEVDAPVVLVEFADYRCPYCGVHARETIPVLVEEYVDKGLLRIEWRDMPLFGDQSIAAAVATRAAGEQGLFWEYSAAIFAYEQHDHQDLPRTRLLEIAQQIGVPDMAAFEAALDDPALMEKVSSDATEAQSLGVSSTPTFAVGGIPLLGAQPLEVFREAIESELALVEG